MKKTYIFVAIAILAVIGIGVFIGAPQSISQEAPEQSAVAAKDGSKWSIRCDEPKEGEENKATYCEMFQRLVTKDTGQRVVEFAIGVPEGAETARGVMILPLGVLVQSGVSIKIDGEKDYTVGINHCTAAGCFAFLGLTDEVLTELRKGNQASLTFRAQNGKAISVPMSLEGFGQAYKKLG